MVIDAHVHFWKFDKQRDAWITDDMKVLQQDYLPEHLASTLKRNGVDGVVAVQASQEEVETRFLAELAKTHPIIKGVVGWIDLQADNITERLAHFTQYTSIRGYRHVVQAEPDDFLLRPNFQRGVRALQSYNYTYDVLIYHSQLKPAIEFVSKFPDQKLIIDHCAKPDIRHKKIDEWKVLMKEIAQQPNVYCKLSGLFTEAAWKTWSAAEFYPYLDVVFEAFGTDRLVFGSDWPVILVSGIYVQWKSLLEKYMERFQEEEKEKVFGLNAVRFYDL
ncbi:amidohydrolase family protein [Pseudoflavitalea sp. X16]|uniref:amidohydrolase family protein n=1 Tax=Paraflavitalea devenefica TaxID=2716334 RepID=UPI001423FED2|nr:amidohydrolase family protein [Paraflavitalea devenefica]NII24129.1 amidohydrolase family protein [Paraflavitalea devenefica]